MRILPLSATVCGLSGAACVALGLPLEANIIWLISNPLFIIHFYKINEHEVIIMYLVFSLIAILGVMNLW